MPRLAWTTFLDRHSASHLHLVVGAVPIDTDQDLGSRHLQTLHGRLSKLVTRLGATGAYSVTIVRQAGAPEIHAAFEKSEDASRLAGVVGAKTEHTSPDWASRRFFVLDDATGAAITAGMATEGELDER